MADVIHTSDERSGQELVATDELGYRLNADGSRTLLRAWVDRATGAHEWKEIPDIPTRLRPSPDVRKGD